MSGNFKKEDLRVVKTRKVICESFFSLLEARSFSKITVYDICDSALISRAAFYAHFQDKYDLLNYCLIQIKQELLDSVEYKSNQYIKHVVKTILRQYNKKLKNLLRDSNWEIIKLLFDFLSPSAIADEHNQNGEIHSAEQTALSCFCAGGMMNLFLWQSKNEFSLSDEIHNYICELLKNILEWDKEKKES